jgi:transposase
LWALREEGTLLTVEDWAEIRRLHFAEGLGKQTIAKSLGIARNTVKAALANPDPPIYRRKRRPSAVDPYEDQIRALLRGCPTMPATVIAERISWTRGMTILKERVAELRPLFLEPDPFQRTDYRPGELAQWDMWLPGVDIPVGYGHTGQLPVIVGVAGYSRLIVARMIPSREGPDVLLGHYACLVDLGGVPRKGVYDNEASIGRKRRHGTVFTHEFLAFKGALGMGAVILEQGHPERKGVVERAIGYLETSFLPGRTFTSAGDFNSQLCSWLSRANARIHRGIRCRPIDRLNEDLASMMALPPVAPDVRHRFSTRLGRDHYVRFGTCDYSVHPRAIGRRIEVTADLDFVVVTCSGEEVAHHRRSLAPHRTITAVDHARARREMRARKPDEKTADLDVDVEQRDLAVYDKALGIA